MSRRNERIGFAVETLCFIAGGAFIGMKNYIAALPFLTIAFTTALIVGEWIYKRGLEDGNKQNL